MNVYVSSPTGCVWMDVQWSWRIAEWKALIRSVLRIPYEFTLVHHNRLYLPHDTPIPETIFVHEFSWNQRAHVRVERVERT
jgi:hypothetical protein